MSHHSISPQKTIYTVMPDFGGAYGWMIDDGKLDCGVGVCIAGSNGWHGKSPISAELHEAFMAWQSVFEEKSMLDYAGQFDQAAFDAEGIMLARRLKAELGDSVCVIYEKVENSPDERNEILPGGALLRLPMRNEMWEGPASI